MPHRPDHNAAEQPRNQVYSEDNDYGDFKL
jgi:hypothetical protein